MSDEVRKYPLTDDQFERLWEGHYSIKTLGEIVGQAIIAAAEEATKNERLMWECVRELTGDSGKLKIDWINRCVEARDHDNQ